MMVRAFTPLKADSGIKPPSAQTIRERSSLMGFAMALVGGWLWTTAALATTPEFSYNDHDKRDPFWPLVSPTGELIDYEKGFQLTDLKMEGIMVADNGKNLAIINGKVIKENDRLGPVTVIEIKKDMVILSNGQQRFELRMKKEKLE